MINSAINITDGMQANLNGISKEGRLYTPYPEPLYTVCATEGVYAVSNPLQTEENTFRDQTSPPIDNVFIFKTSLQRDFMLTSYSFVKAKIVLLILPQ